ncbi:MAG: hypothetical protein EOP51_13735 [Sphingobacteriales bacterium]|nr:MAG: hypothetical protein EOP51_13735 [Sphingobacteriales bacterium]
MKLNPPFFLAGSIAILCLLCSTAGAQMKPAVRDSIYSDVLKETRIFMVTMPEVYKPGSTDKYDVMYALDGERQERILPSIQSFNEWLQVAPPNIVVDLYNTDRNRDFTPTHTGDNATSGGAAKFLLFIKTELVPYINKKYPSNNSNGLFGHSLGGLFAMYAFLQEPNLFESYIACDPSFWWDNRYMVKQVAAKLDSTYANSNKALFLTGREGNDYAGMGIEAMDSVLKAKAISGLNVKTIVYQNENHGTIVLKTIYDGLRYIYTGYANRTGDVIIYPQNGIMLKDKPIIINCFSDPETIRYTTDGTGPKLNSAKMQTELTLTKPGKLKLKAFPYRVKNEKVTTGNFKLGEAWPPGALPKNVQQGGLKYAFYKGEWEKMPDFKKLKPAATGLINDHFEWNQLPTQANFALVIDGYIEIKEEGYHMFVLDSDDGSKLYLNNKLLINHDGLTQMQLGSGQTYILPLKKGIYPIRLEYFLNGGRGGLSLKYVTPNTSKFIGIPDEVLYHK